MLILFPDEEEKKENEGEEEEKKAAKEDEEDKKQAEKARSLKNELKARFDQWKKKKGNFLEFY